nr:MAG TPA: stabilization protein [Caudoviricetes sp.]
MRFPKLSEQPTSRSITDVFAGYNHTIRIGDGEFYDEENMCSDNYPLLSTRRARGVYASPAAPQGLIAKDALCYVDGTKFVINNQRIEMNLSTAAEKCPKSLISMGSYVIIMPDKKYINTVEVSDRGNIEASYQSGSSVRFSLCTAEGADVEAVASETAPEEPGNGAYWLDTSGKKHALKVYSSATDIWTAVATTYVKISATGIGTQFKQYDGVTIAGITEKSVEGLNGSAVIWSKADDYIVVVGLLDAAVEQTAEKGVITVKRTMPDMDFVVESGNRLWGCKYSYDKANGKDINEIYASKLGDFKNWSCYMGISTDSYTASCGTDGPWTGAITHLGYPLFFKENCLHKVYGTFPSNFQIQTTTCRGVQKGSARSMAIINEVLYYKSRGGVCAYDGSLPAEISAAFGEESYSDAVGGGHRNKYYVSMQDSGGAWHLFTYDTRLGVWHREDNTHAEAWCSCRDEMYYIDASDKKIRTVLGSGTKETAAVPWKVETGTITALTSSSKYPDRIANKKYVGRMLIRMALEQGATMQAYIQYDSGTWEKLWSMTGKNLRTFSFPVRPHRCDHFRLRLTGAGGAKIYSITKTLEQGSDEM